MVALGACRLCVHSRAQGAHLESEKSGGRRGEAAGWRWALLQCLRRRRNGEAVVRATGGRLSAAHRYNISTTILQHFLLTLASAFWEGGRGAGGDGGTGRASLALAAHTTLANDTQKQI